MIFVCCWFKEGVVIFGNKGYCFIWDEIIWNGWKKIVLDVKCKYVNEKYYRDYRIKNFVDIS